MPTYQYACTECGHRFEATQSFTDASLTECPACRGKLRKLFGAVGIVFKGSGFYRTDNRGANSTSSTPQTSKTSSEAASAPSTTGSTPTTATTSSAPSTTPASSAAP